MDTEGGKKQMAKEPSELFGMTKTFFTVIWAHTSATALHSKPILHELERLMHYSDFFPPVSVISVPGFSADMAG